MSTLPKKSTREQRRRFVIHLEKRTNLEVWRLLSRETAEDLCALVEFASPTLRETILRRIRITDD